VSGIRSGNNKRVTRNIFHWLLRRGKLREGKKGKTSGQWNLSKVSEKAPRDNTNLIQEICQKSTDLRQNELA